MSTATIARPAAEPWPVTDNGIVIVDIDELRASWEARTGPDNIRRNWQSVGVADVLDTEWLAAHVDAFEDDALIALWVDCCSFGGDADLSAQIAVMTPRMVALWEEGETRIDRARAALDWLPEDGGEE